MESGEIVAVVVVVIVLFAGSIFLCFRCWRAVGEVIEDDQKPKRETFISSMRDGLRRSFRSSMQKMSGLRNSFRRSGSPKKRPAAVVVGTPAVATITGLRREASELHPSYLKQTLNNEQAGAVRRGEASVGDVMIDDPTASLGGRIKPSPNPLYESPRPTAQPPPLQTIQAHLSGYSRMEEDSVDALALDSITNAARHGEESDQGGFINQVYQEDSPSKLPERYDVPFEEHKDHNSSSSCGPHEVAVDLGEDSVTFSADRSTYI